MTAMAPGPRLIAWEITRSCNLSCSHCRASSIDKQYPDELSTQECFSLIDSVIEVAQPVLILTGGEPLYRDDFFEIAGYASSKGLRVAIGSNGTMITKNMAARLSEIPVSRLGISVDFPLPALQDEFRGMSGAFDAALLGIENALNSGMEIQINSTITKRNVRYIDDLLSLALDLGAVAFHPFMLVPTGRGKSLESDELPAEEYERVLHWIYEKQKEIGDRIFFKPTDAPHYMRIRMQLEGDTKLSPSSNTSSGMNSLTRGCLAGTGFCFISHVGLVQGCGYLDIEAGNIREKSFGEIWNTSPLFKELRDHTKLRGKCGVCEYKAVCGGCRARAFEKTGDYLGEEPYCVYQPKSTRHAPVQGVLNK